MTGAGAGSLRARIAGRLPLYRKPTILGLSIFGYVLFAWLMLAVPGTPNFKSIVGFDSFAYWNVDAFHPYNAALGTIGSFTYSPALALVASPAHLLPFGLFFVLWDSFLIVNLVWLTRRMTLVWLVFPAGAARALPRQRPHPAGHGLRPRVRIPGAVVDRPAHQGHARSLAALVRRSAGNGDRWLGSGRDRGHLGRFVRHCPGRMVRLAEVLTSAQSTGAGSNDWYAFLFPPLWLRLAAAACLVVWGARTDRRWVVPVATAIAMPVIWVTTPAILVAIPRLRHKSPALAPNLPPEPANVQVA